MDQSLSALEVGQRSHRFRTGGSRTRRTRLAATEDQSDTLRRARDLVQRAVRRFADQEESQAGDRAIVALRGHAQQILNSEIERVRIRHGRKATAEDVEFALRHMLRQLLCTYPRSGAGNC